MSKNNSDIDDLIVGMATEFCNMGAEAATKGFRAWFESKGLFDSGALSRWEFEAAVFIIEQELPRQVSAALEKALKGEEK